MRRQPWLFLLGASLAVLASCLFALRFGALHLPLATIAHALFLPGGSLDEVAIRSLRLPRVILAATVGASLAVAGVLLQGVTRNPLGSPELFGVLAGTEGGAVFALFIFHAQSLYLAIISGVAGGTLALVLVFLLARLSPQGDSIIAVAIAGFSVGIAIEGLTGILIKWQDTRYESINRWAEASLGGRDPHVTFAILPVVGLALAAALACAAQLNVLQLGDEAAIGLGLHTSRLRLVAFASVVVLTSSSVVAAGPIGFVGLVAPHVARAFTGSDHRFLIPAAALVGAASLILADLCARTLLAGVFDELPLSALTTALGAPAFLFILRRRLGTA